MKKNPLILLALFALIAGTTIAQSLYTARGYWEESNKVTYRTIKDKQEKGQTISNDEENYLKDYEIYLNTYYNRLSEEEKMKYEQMKPQWDSELTQPVSTSFQQKQIDQAEFEWRPRDRGLQAAYGIYYGSSLVAIAEISNGAAAGIPLITGGLWMLGPVVNPKKYEGITISTIRAANTGKILGLGYGAALGLTIGGDSGDTYKLALGFSTLGSIGLGEIAFQAQKKKNFTDGHIELMRHYGFLGPWIGASLIAATNTEETSLIGLSLLAGGVGGLTIGNKAAHKYDYTRGDVDVISSFTLLTTAAGFTGVIEYLENNNNPSNTVILVPAATSIIGTILGQRMVKNVHLTKKQGSTINLTTSGAALLGFGIMAISNSDSPTAWVGVPTACALIAHQTIFNKFKKENLVQNLKGYRRRNNNVDFSMKVTPENYFINKKLSLNHTYNLNRSLANPIVLVALKFRYLILRMNEIINPFLAGLGLIIQIN